MTKPTAKKVEVKSTLDIIQTNNNPVLGPSEDNPPRIPEDYVVEVVDNRTESIVEYVKDAESNLLESNLKETYSINSEGRTTTQLGRGGVKFATGFQNLTAVLETGFSTYDEALVYLNNNINSPQFQYEEGFSIKKVYNRK